MVGQAHISQIIVVSDLPSPPAVEVEPIPQQRLNMAAIALASWAKPSWVIQG
ncbi:hypothetical protein PC116_g9627 [Phytophthora cactorum]|uniref:Uncharacterized protein n=1 Tax=Phytophthora cactorum TaxID=29920 RepID=A0A8T1E8V3_9STRA|nr:hypothetical protein PC117_g6612 [Phytophthora cactorum]KAG4242488.1 hypothetical protein PC116_g9627 [Phytophthora cactorum]